MFFGLLYVPLRSQVDMRELNMIYRMIDSSKTQADMNYYSYQLSKFWSDRLEQIEQKIIRQMRKGDKIKFKKSMGQWRSHVESMSELRSTLFKKDFINPRYYQFNSFESKVTRSKKGTLMQPFIYNMSKALYYEDKWVELDVLFNSN